VDLLAAGGARPGAKGDSVDDEVCRGKPWNAEGGLDGVHQDIQASKSKCPVGALWWFQQVLLPCYI